MTSPSPSPSRCPSPTGTDTATAGLVLVGLDRWAACSATEFGYVGAVRHIVRAGALTTVCGASASHPEIWRANTRKPRCADCVKRYGTRHEQR